MSVDIKLNLIKPSKDLLAAAYVYTVISRANHYLNQNQKDILVTFSFINKDWYNVINNLNFARDICTKLIINQKLNSKETKVLSYYKKAIKTESFKVDKIYSKKLNEYQKHILPKLKKLFNSIFTNTTNNLELNLCFIYQPLVGETKGSALKTGIIFNVDNNFKNENKFISLITNELIHVICDNNSDYIKLIEKVNYNYKFNEAFTSTIENLCMYSLKLNDVKYKYYRYDGLIRDDAACKMEDKIRKVYDSWEKSKSKDNFVVYLDKNLKKVIKI